jgi:hypothetical protein
LKRRTFLFISFGLLVLFFSWLVIDYLLFLIRDPENAVVHNNWIHIIIFAIYFAVAYLLIFLRGWCKTPPVEQTWPPARCYGLLLWTLLTVLPAYPLCGRHSARVHIAFCIAVDILFLLRMIKGRIKNEKGWIWQQYAVAYVWLESFLPALAIELLF